ncbi:MAG: hypothetical protein ABH878_08285, partial [bacterium]
MFGIINLNVGVTLFSLKGVDLGPEVTAFGYAGGSRHPGANNQPRALTVPWQMGIQPEVVEFTLLSWRCRLSEFAGRDAEMAKLNRWSTSDLPVSVRFIIGDGGVGKTRLAAEFATALHSQRWAAGFVNLRSDVRTFFLKKAGTLLVIDYPEENPTAVRELLCDLIDHGAENRLRVLFLTRQRLEDWDELIYDSHADTIVDRRPIQLGSLDVQAAHRVFNSALEKAAEVHATTPPPLSEEQIKA